MNAENTLLRATGRRHFVREYAGPLSIKTVVAGEVTWMVDGRPHTVRPGSMLVLNDGQPYSMDINKRHPVATAVVFFARGFVEQACRPLNLDEPFIAPSVGFHTRVRPLSKQLKRNIETGDFHAIARELAAEHRDWSRIPAIRPSTRDELLRRLSRGREFLNSSLTESVTLRRAAAEACLSDYHFHRLFTRVYRETPHEFLERRRLEVAKQLLERDSCSVSEIAFATGFGKAGALTASFHRRYGVTPSEYRKNSKIWEALDGIGAITCAS